MRYFTLLLFTILISACSQPKPVVDTRPVWINAPYIDNETAAVGSAHTHYYGKTAQRKLAISRALDELALQQGVKVMTQTLRHNKKAGRFITL